MVFGDVCMNCAERYMGCHGKCQRYLDAKAAYDAKKDAIRVQKERERDATELKAGAQEKAMKRHNTKR